MPIVIAPHPSLRQVAKPVTDVDKKILEISQELSQTLLARRNPRGVGLAAPQINKAWRMFALNLTEIADKAQPNQPSQLQVLINPELTAHSDHHVFGPQEDDPTYEGCLSIPRIYGPVPRWEWIELEYYEIVDGRLESRHERMEWFTARVAQHELDHLNGVLFTDYSLKYDLPLFQENDRGKWIEIEDREMIAAL